MQAAKARLDAAENFKERRETLSALAAATETELAEAGLILAKSRRKAAATVDLSLMPAAETADRALDKSNVAPEVSQ